MAVSRLPVIWGSSVYNDMPHSSLAVTYLSESGDHTLRRNVYQTMLQPSKCVDL